MALSDAPKYYLMNSGDTTPTVRSNYSPIRILPGMTGVRLHSDDTVWWGAQLMQIGADDEYHLISPNIVNPGNLTNGTIDLTNYNDGTYYMWIMISTNYDSSKCSIEIISQA